MRVDSFHPKLFGEYRSIFEGVALFKELGKTLGQQNKKQKTEEDRVKARLLALERRNRLKRENEEQTRIINRHRHEQGLKKSQGIYVLDGGHDDWVDMLQKPSDTKRYQAQKKATPKWADTNKIRDIYSACVKLNENETDDPYAVDHYYPILGKDVCGLHVPENLRIIRRSENSTKGNKHPEDI